MNDNTNKISNILQQVRLLKDKYDELAAVTGEQFNVFSILGVEADEVRTHSAFLVDLLDPQGSHRQGDAFQKLFLKVALNHSGPDEYRNPETFQVTKEGFTDQGRIDILLENKEACIVIENKIYAQDQKAQMKRYYQYARSKRFSEEQIKLVYLTLDGSPPSKKSLGSLSVKRVKCLSYSEDIIKWLEECMKLQEVQRVSPIREIVFQYRDLLKQLTGQSTNKRLSMELKNILTENKNYELIPDLEKMILQFKGHVQLEFWKTLTDTIKEKVHDACEPSEEDMEALKQEISYYYSGRSRAWVGMTYKLKWEQTETEIALRVELGSAEYGRVYYGFVLFEDGNRVEGTCKDKAYNAIAERLPDGFRRTGSFIGLKHPARNFLFPLDYSGRNENYLQDDNSRIESVQEFVAEIKEAVAQLKENLN